jgi:hypothetical protein
MTTCAIFISAWLFIFVAIDGRAIKASTLSYGPLPFESWPLENFFFLVIAVNDCGDVQLNCLTLLCHLCAFTWCFCEPSGPSSCQDLKVRVVRCTHQTFFFLLGNQRCCEFQYTMFFYKSKYNNNINVILGHIYCQCWDR